MTNLTITIPEIAKAVVIEALRNEAWEIARKAVADTDAVAQPFFAAVITAPDMAEVHAQIDSLMDAVAEISGWDRRGDWADGLIADVRADIATARAELEEAKRDLSRQAADTAEWRDAAAAVDQRRQQLVRLTAV